MAALITSINTLSGLFSNIYLADFFDVLIISLMLYSAFLLFKQTRSSLVLIGIGIVLAVYAAAQIFNLYLTSIVLQSFFSVFIVVIVIIFQEELRRFFELIAIVGTRQMRVQPISAGSAAIDALFQSVSYLAHNKIGALIVIRGKENLDRHIEGGTTLDGIISEDLIISIFDPTSPGHDGAIIINKDRISMIGAHLPLSNNFPEIGKHGTRHSAALGIAEVSDALAIVVSEEQGTISIAHGGTLETFGTFEEFQKKLIAFLKEIAPEQTYTAIEHFIKRNPLEKILAVLAAAFLWFFIAFRADTVQREFIIPITYRNVPDGLVIEESKPKEVTVTLEGRGSSWVERLDPTALEVGIDASSIKNGFNSIGINGTMVSRPLNLSVINMEPGVLELIVKRYRHASVEIKPQIDGKAATGFRIESVAVSPSNIEILVPETFTPPAALWTEKIHIENLKETTTFPADIITPQNVRLGEKAEQSVFVTITVVPR